MANWDVLKAAVAQYIKTNGNEEITGQIMQDVLNNIISNIGENATFKGVADLTTAPGNPDGNIFYLAFKEGVYSNFSAIELDGLSVYSLMYDVNLSKWVKNQVVPESYIIENLQLATNQQEGYIDELGNIVANTNFRYSIISVEEGDEYYYSGYTLNSLSTGVVAILNGGGVSVLVDGDYSLSMKKFTVPANCSEIRCSSSNVGYSLGVYKKNVNSKFINDIVVIYELLSVMSDRLGGVDFFENYISQSVNSNDGTFTDSANWARTEFVRVQEGDILVYSGITSTYNPIVGYDENKQFVTGTIISPGGTYSNEEFTIPNGVSYIVASARNLEGDTFSLKYKTTLSGTSLTLGDFVIELKQIASSLGQPFMGSLLGYLINQPRGADTAIRYYLIPKGSPTGVKSKFEMFATDYEADSANYSAMNLLVFGDRIEFGANRNGTETDLKQIYGGKYVGSSLQSGSARTEYSGTEERITHLFDILTLKRIDSNGNVIPLQEYADNSAAIADGLHTGDIYRTGDFLKIVHA